MSAHAQREAAEIREQWLGRALSTLPADRPAAEAAISSLYDLIGLPPPRFHWAASPLTALATVPPGLGRAESLERVAEWPLPPRLIALRNELRRGLDAKVRGLQHTAATSSSGVRSSPPLLTSTGACLLQPLQRAHTGEFSWSNRWYESQLVPWIAHYDALRRVAGVVFTAEQLRQWELWATVAASCHWWWPAEHVCVVSERPVALHTEVSGDEGPGAAAPRGRPGPALRRRLGPALLARHPRTGLGDRRPDRRTHRGRDQRRGQAVRHRAPRLARVRRAGRAEAGSARRPTPATPAPSCGSTTCGGRRRCSSR
ncbi:hypothetical protein GCM10020220_101080 [Nonomuraea rubra]